MGAHLLTNLDFDEESKEFQQLISIIKIKYG